MAKHNSLTAAASLLLLGVPLYYVRFSVLAIPTNFLEIAVLAFVGSVAWQTYRTQRSWKLPYLWPTLLMLLGITLGVIVAHDRETALGIWKSWFVIPILFSWAVVQISHRDTLPLYRLALLVNILIVSSYALLQWLGAIPLIAHQTLGGNLEQYVAQGRALAFFESPNYLTMYLLPLGVFLLFSSQSHIQRLILLFPLLILWLTGTRSAVITLGLVAVVWILTAFPKQRKVFAGVALALLAGLAFYLMPRISLTGVDSLRLGIWQVAVDTILHQPFFGIGPGQFLEVFQQSSSLSRATYEGALPYALHPHNLYLNFWLSGGIFALLGLLWIGWQTLRDGLRSYPSEGYAAALALTAIFIHGCLDSTYFKNDLALIFWFLIAIVWLTRRKQAKKQTIPS